MDSIIGWEKRLINFIVDVFVIQMISLMLTMLIGYQMLKDVDTKAVGISIEIDYLFVMVMFGYYFILEVVFGKTIGKFITKTKVMGYHGEKATVKQILVRSLVRFIPIEFFSFMSEKPEGWHDSFSSTKVVKG